MVALKSVRRVSSRTHIKQEPIAATAIATFVHYAFRNLRPTIRCVPLVAANKRRGFMAARAIWKGEIKVGSTKVPVKLCGDTPMTVN